MHSHGCSHTHSHTYQFSFVFSLSVFFSQFSVCVCVFPPYLYTHTHSFSLLLCLSYTHTHTHTHIHTHKHTQTENYTTTNRTTPTGRELDEAEDWSRQTTKSEQSHTNCAVGQSSTTKPTTRCEITSQYFCQLSLPHSLTYSPPLSLTPSLPPSLPHSLTHPHQKKYIYTYCVNSILKQSLFGQNGSGCNRKWLLYRDANLGMNYVVCLQSDHYTEVPLYHTYCTNNQPQSKTRQKREIGMQ